MKQRITALLLTAALALSLLAGGLPAAYAADLYLNGEKTAELTLRPVEGGTSLD